MIFCLDTNICIYALKGYFPEIGNRIRMLAPQDIGIPAMVRAEMLLGAAKSDHPSKTLSIVEAFLAPYTCLPFDKDAADVYARIRAKLEKSGQPIGPNDFVIAATAIASNSVLVTHNVAEFRRIPELTIEDWTVLER